MLSDPVCVGALVIRMIREGMEYGALRLAAECLKGNGRRGGAYREAEDRESRSPPPTRAAPPPAPATAPSAEPASDGDLSAMYDRALRLLTSSNSANQSTSGSDSSPWQLVVHFTQSALTHSVCSPLILSTRMRALYALQRHRETLSTFSLFAARGIEPQGADYDEAILAHLLLLQLPEAQALLAEKGERGHPTTAQTVLALLEGMAPFGGNRVMEQKVLNEADAQQLRRRQAVRQDVRVLNRMLSVRAARGNLADALALVDYFDFASWPRELVRQIRALDPALPFPAPAPSSSHSSASPSSRSRAPSRSSGPPHPASHHFRPQPDLSTVVTLVGMALREHRADLALRLLSTASDLDLGFNAHLAASIVRTLLALHDLPAAEEFVRALPRGEAEFAQRQYARMDPVPPMVYEELFGGILRHRGLRGANEALRAFTARGGGRTALMPVTDGMTRALVAHLSLEVQDGGGTLAGADLLVKVQHLTRQRVRPSAADLGRLLEAAWRTERVRRRQTLLTVEEEFPLPDEAELPPGPRTTPNRPPPEPQPASSVPLPREAELLASTPLSRSSSSSPAGPSSLSRVRDSLSDRGVPLSRTSTRHILRNEHLLRFIPQKWAYLQSQVLDLGIRPSVQHLAILIRAYLRLGDAKGAHLALEYALDELGLEPHVALYSALIAGLARLGEHSAVTAAFADMRARGVEPDRTLFAALAMSAARKRDVAGVEKVLDEVRKQARARAPQPQVVALAHAQSLRGRGRAGAAGVPSTLLTAYDPLLDAVFVSILYRALVSAARVRDAEELLKDSLEKGLVPDGVLLQALRRTERWLARKVNNATGQTPPPSSPSSSSPSFATPATPATPATARTAARATAQATEVGTGSARLGSAGETIPLVELEDLAALVQHNLKTVLGATRGMKHTASHAEVKRLREYWVAAEEKLSRRKRARRKKEAKEAKEREQQAVDDDLDAELRRIEEEHGV
ncbi:hypothetical protein JCM10213_002822 [Rhodosporidiobolus nylandii]